VLSSGSNETCRGAGFLGAAGLGAAPRLRLVSSTVGPVSIAQPGRLYAPGGTRDLDFSTNSQLGATVKTNDGGEWLSVALDGTGSFRFSFPYRIRLAPTAAMGNVYVSLAFGNSTSNSVLIFIQ
jgi:hypothetical protein